MVYVCDAIMGTGKSSAAINYINNNLDKKFIYITPYLDEASRIKSSCKKARFVEPSNKLKEFNFAKHNHTAALIKESKNIATTQQSFKSYTQEVLNDINSLEYTLIVDENVDILEKADVKPGDIEILLAAGYIECVNETYKITDKGLNYNGDRMRDLFFILKSRELIKLGEDSDDRNIYFWTLPPNLLTSFKDVYILSYMFEGQSLHHFLNIYGIPYTYIGINKINNSSYEFCEAPGYEPEYVSKLKDMIHIIDNPKLNAIGDDYFSLSINWFERHPNEIKQLKNNVFNCFHNIWKDYSSSLRLWGTYQSGFSKLKGKGYTKAYLAFNTKATNLYKDRICLAYPVNIFMNVNEKKFYNMHGIEVDEGKYALSIMIQWIWRSAIRDGQEINIYIPSRRMRELLINWIEHASSGCCKSGGDANGQTKI